MLHQVEYIWVDGTQPTQKLRSKTRILNIDPETVSLDSFPEWGFDGSSTYQASGHASDLALRPVCFVNDPIRVGENYLLLCEVMNADGTPHASNTRAQLREILAQGAAQFEPWIGFEQEYTLFKEGRPLGWPAGGYPPPQGPFYCGVGTNQVYGRDLVEAHTQACLDADIMIYGTNAEVMPSQWEYQIGYRGVDGESADPLTVADHAWIARWLLFRIAEEFDIEPSLDNKPVKGDWNGAGQHTNFSTKAMRDPKTGLEAIQDAIIELQQHHAEHIAVYGHGLEDRLTGLHETCSIHEFRSGYSDRGASIRIPLGVQKNGCGYIEDRRPGANADPYVVAGKLLSTICKIKTTDKKLALV
jgi:glutamine synthetase